MLEALALPAINRLLRENTWALERLREHSGKVALVRCPPVALQVAVMDSGELTNATSSAPTVTIDVTPAILLGTGARDPAPWNAGRVTGDAEFAAALDYVRRNIQWDYEEALSRIVGDVAAHRLAGATKRLDVWARETAFKLAQTVTEYVIHEKPVVTSAHAVEQFNREIDVLRDDVERLDKRLELLARKSASR